jgi:lipoate-protein ligase A
MTVSSVFRLAGLDPWDNLAREEVLLDTLPLGASALVLYINRPCVVIGRHQNPLREIRLDELARRGVPVVRRPSGGGTVWHDEGNLNWSLLMPKDGYDRGAVTAAVALALAPLGLALNSGEKGDLFLDGKKVSGAAYLFRRDRVMHHGTLLCRARLDDLRGVLGPTGELKEWVGVASRPMPVANLNIEVEAAVTALITAFGGSSSSANSADFSKQPDDSDFENRVSARRGELRSPEWTWDQTPPFVWHGATLAGTLTARVKDGFIEETWDDRNRNMSTMVGKCFFDPTYFGFIPARRSHDEGRAAEEVSPSSG